MPKKTIIKRHSTAELKDRRARGESQTNAAVLRKKSAAELENDIASDADFSGEPTDWYQTAQAIMPKPKTLLSLRLDDEVIDWFRQQGPGYQTRINAVLRAFVQREEKRRT